MKGALGLALVITIALASRGAAADDNEAIAAMRRGVAAFGRGDAEEALREYEAAKRAAPAANMPFRYAAEALLTLGRHRQAVESLEAYLAKRPNVGDAAEVRVQIARIRATYFPARARITTNAEGAEVLVDGLSRGAAPVLEATPGRHQIEVRAAGYQPASQSVTLVGDQDAALVFTLQAAPVAPPPQVTPPPPVGPSDTWRAVGWVVGGVGVATLVTSFVVDAGVLGPKIADYRSAADRGDPSARGLRDDARGIRTVTIVGYASGGVLIAGGAALVLFAPRPGANAALRLSPWLAADRGGLGASGTF